MTVDGSTYETNVVFSSVFTGLHFLLWISESCEILKGANLSTAVCCEVLLVNNFRCKKMYYFVNYGEVGFPFCGCYNYC